MATDTTRYYQYLYNPEMIQINPPTKADHLNRILTTATHDGEIIGKSIGGVNHESKISKTNIKD